MALGSELVLVLDASVLERLAGAGWNAAYEDEATPLDLVNAANDAVQHGLAAAHRRMLEARFGTVADDDHRRYLHAQTPAGPRRFRILQLEGFGPQDNTHQVLGVSLWSRYKPVWCDWRHPYGGSGDHIVFDAELLDMVAQARTELAPVIPELADAPMAVVQQFY